tara:strand:+ start:3447 stop:3719 length:273 start_codon:yes stop_codon:yes gene_type:complete
MAKSVKEFWGAGSQRDKLIEFYRAIKDRGADQSMRSLAETDLIKVRDLAKRLIKDHSTSSGQLKSMLESAKWTTESIDSVLKTDTKVEKT